MPGLALFALLRDLKKQGCAEHEVEKNCVFAWGVCVSRNVEMHVVLLAPKVCLCYVCMAHLAISFAHEDILFGLSPNFV